MHFHSSHLARNIWVQAGLYSDTNQFRIYIYIYTFPTSILKRLNVKSSDLEATWIGGKTSLQSCGLPSHIIAVTHFPVSPLSTGQRACYLIQTSYNVWVYVEPQKKTWKTCESIMASTKRDLHRKHQVRLSPFALIRSLDPLDWQLRKKKKKKKWFVDSFWLTEDSSIASDSFD